MFYIDKYPQEGFLGILNFYLKKNLCSWNRPYTKQEIIQFVQTSESGEMSKAYMWNDDIS